MLGFFMDFLCPDLHGFDNTQGPKAYNILSRYLLISLNEK
jgi:hypothetical protein